MRPFGVRCWVRRHHTDGDHVLAWYLLDDGTWVHLSSSYGLRLDLDIMGDRSKKLLLQLEQDWHEEASFASLQPSDRMTP